ISVFIQLVALVSPLFFQVVIDKVLVHRAMTTLEVLVIGLLVINVADVLLNWLRTYCFAHRRRRMDAILRSHLFRHLVALPIAYFESRATGQTVARVRELENVRQFITSSALTLVIDVVFGLIFLAVMFWYSRQLTLVVVISIPFYAVISAFITPVLKVRVQEKFQRGAVNQSLLVESLAGIQTLKAMAVEPAVRQRWAEQLAGYVGSSRGGGGRLADGRPGQQGHERRDPLVRRPGGDRQHDDDRRVRRLQHAGRPDRRAGAAARPAVAGFSAVPPFHRAPRRHHQYAHRAQ